MIKNFLIYFYKNSESVMTIFIDIHMLYHMNTFQYFYRDIKNLKNICSPHHLVTYFYFLHIAYKTFYGCRVCREVGSMLLEAYLKKVYF